MLRYSIVEFICSFTSETILPLYSGNIFRGALGKSLRNICCPLKRVSCQECLLFSGCVYAFLFESKVIKQKNRSPNLPLPFILEPPFSGKERYAPLEDFRFSIILIEGGIRWLSYIIYSVIEMGKVGIGLNRKEGGGRFEVKRVIKDKRVVYEDSSQGIMVLPEEHGSLKIEDIAPPTPPMERIRVDFLTPYRVKFRNSLITDFDFSVLIRACLRRISSLEATYCGGEPSLDYRGLIARSREVEIVEEQKRWMEIRRFSFRQRSSMRLGGLVGHAIYRGELLPFYPLLKYCEIVHVGKQTTFGFGKIRVWVP